MKKEFIKLVKEQGADLMFSSLEIDDEQVLNSEIVFENALMFNNYQEFIKNHSQLIKGFF